MKLLRMTAVGLLLVNVVLYGRLVGLWPAVAWFVAALVTMHVIPESDR